MPIYDLTPEQLEVLRGPGCAEPDDFDEFWRGTLAEVAEHPLRPVSQEIESPLRTVRVFDVSFAGWGGHPVHGWLLQPASEAHARGIGVVEYVGYGGGRGVPLEWLAWPSAGYSYLVIDARGQGGGYRTGITPDPDQGGASQVPGFMTKGIASPDGYYYRRLYADSVRALDMIRSVPGVDARRVAVVGTSQGGGLAIAAAALGTDVQALVTAVPFLCDFRRGAEVAKHGPFTEIAAYCAQRPKEVEQVFHTLSYFDGVHLARRCPMPALWNIALMDELVPPSTVLAAYTAYRGEARLSVHPFAGHEDARGEQARDALQFLEELRPVDRDAGRASV